MQNPESLKRSIKSAEDLSGVVRTMKTMAAVSIRQYEVATASLSVYARTIRSGISMMLDETHGSFAGQQATTGQTGAIVYGTDQGMCGQFNEQISHFAAARMQDESPQGPPVICVGHRIADKLSANGLKPGSTFRLPGSAFGITALVQDLLPSIDEWRATNGINRILVFHNRRLTASSWRPHCLQLLPLDLERFREQRTDQGHSLPFWTMNSDILLSRLVRQFLFVSLFQASAESMAGENASRIAAMQSAERNIKERLQLLRSEYSQQRQTTITEELLDVVTGFEALQQSKQGD